MRLLDFIDRNRRILEPIAYFAVLVIGYIDYVSGPDIALSIFYLVPVFVVAWSVGTIRAFPVCLLSSIAWLIADIESRVYAVYPAVYVWNSVTRFGFFLFVAFLITSLKRSLEQEARLARADSLTGLANTKGFFEAGEQEISRAQRYGHPCTVAYIDVDNFKAVNDEHGHSVGDKLLSLIGESIRNNVRLTDTAARLGGDEFVVLFSEISADQARTAIEKLRGELTAVMRNNDWPVTMSIGVATFIRPPATVDEMLEKADHLMYSAKRSGKNTLEREVIT